MPEIFSPLSILVAGLTLGLTHALEADHLTAIYTIVSQKKKISDFLKLGAVWGLGHTTAILTVGMVVLVFKLQLSDDISLVLETLVGVMLVALGINAARNIQRNKIHIHKHEHADQTAHIHFHSHRYNPFHNHAHRSYLVGLVHGLAGSATLVILVVAAIDSILLGLGYLLIFGLGSIVGMGLLSSLLGLPLQLFAEYKKLIISIQYLAAVFSLFIGLNLIVDFFQSI